MAALPGDEVIHRVDRLIEPDPSRTDVMHLEALGLCPDDASLYSDPGYTLILAGRKTDGIESLQKAVGMAPGNTETIHKMCTSEDFDVETGTLFAVLSSRMSMKALITGITGFVGSHLAEYILGNHADVQVGGLIRWRSPKEHIEHILDKVTLFYGNLLDYPSLVSMLGQYRPEIIFHLAAQSYVDFSFVAPVDTLSSNVVGTCNLLEAIKQLKQADGYDPVIHICSSSEVYGQVKADEVPITESNVLRPASPYAVSKVGEDMLAFQYWISWKIRTVRSRMFTHTGPRRGEVFVVSNFAKQVAAIEAGLAEPVIRVGNLDSVRTFSDVRDAVRAYWLLVSKCPAGEVYNIGGTETMTIGQMLDKLLKISTSRDVRVEVDPARLRPSDVTLQIPCVDKFVKATGWKPEIKFDDTLNDTLDYWRDYYRKGS